MQKVCWEEAFYFILTGKKKTVYNEEKVDEEVKSVP